MRNTIIVALAVVCAALILTAPVDAQRMKVTEPRFVGLTSITFPVVTSVRSVSNICNLEFPEARVCEILEGFQSIPSPPEATEPIAMMFFSSGAEAFPSPRLSCFGADDAGTECSFTAEPFRAACCGF